MMYSADRDSQSIVGKGKTELIYESFDAALATNSDDGKITKEEDIDDKQGITFKVKRYYLNKYNYYDGLVNFYYRLHSF